MMELVRTFFGLDNADRRTVVGNPVSVNLKEAGYIRDSNNRITHLHTLCNRYKSTPHELKIKTVYEKTKNIHSYLAAQKRFTELELFHLQNTDHFINTFALIIDVHQKNRAETTARDSNAWDKEAATGAARTNGSREMNNRPNQAKTNHKPGPDNQVKNTAQLLIPDIFLDTSARITYIWLDTTGELITKEIGITSPAQEKEAFVSAMAARIGLYKPDISYVGNALVQMPGATGGDLAGYAPVINWKSYMYALDLNDYRLYPVRIYRKNADK